MAFTKEVKPGTSYTDVAKPTDSWLSHLYGALLCEDGSYLLNEDSSRINLEWYHNKVTKSGGSFTKDVKPNVVWA